MKSYDATNWSTDIRTCRNKEVHVFEVYPNSRVVLGCYMEIGKQRHFIDIGNGLLDEYKGYLDDRIGNYNINGFPIGEKS